MASKICHNIFLTGFMGAGKSTVGKLLANMVDGEFCDLDDVLVKTEGRSIADIFARDGEAFFRDCESRVLNSLSISDRKVYATGGGIVLRESNRRLMQELGCVVYLKADWDVIKQRLATSTDRPLVDQEKGWGAVEKLWASRQPLYENADLVVDTDALDPFLVAKNIFDHFGRLEE